MVLIRGHNICFSSEIRKIILELSAKLYLFLNFDLVCLHKIFSAIQAMCKVGKDKLLKKY